MCQKCGGTCGNGGSQRSCPPKSTPGCLVSTVAAAATGAGIGGAIGGPPLAAVAAVVLGVAALMECKKPCK